MTPTRNRIHGALIAMSLAVPAASMAQNDPSAAQTLPGATGRSSTAQVSAADRKFVNDAATGGLLEVELGKLAVQRAASEAVRQFGQRMMDDHSQAAEQLRQITRAKGMTLPDSLDAKQRKEIERLQKLSGPQFDQAYMKLMLEDHQQDIRVFRKEAQQGSDSDIRSFASATLPKLHDHLALALGAAKTARAIEHSKKPSATGAAETQQARDKTTGAVNDDTSVRRDPEANRESTAPEAQGQPRQ
jgi:putative membrane protein